MSATIAAAKPKYQGIPFEPMRHARQFRRDVQGSTSKVGELIRDISHRCRVAVKCGSPIRKVQFSAFSARWHNELPRRFCIGEQCGGDHRSFIYSISLLHVGTWSDPDWESDEQGVNRPGFAGGCLV
jgi:hypothetical protein